MAGETGFVEAYTFALHTEEHLHQRHLHTLKEIGEPSLLQSLGEIAVEEEGDVRVLRSVELQACGLDLTQIELLRRLRSEHLLKAHHLVAEELLRQFVQSVAHIGIEQVVRYHRVEVLTCCLDAVGEEDVEVVLEVLPDLQRGLTGEDRTKLCQKSGGLGAIGWHIEVVGQRVI